MDTNNIQTATKSIDVPVALIFFNRPEPLKVVFDCIRKNKPSKLFLIQDGPRLNNATDNLNVDKCREIVSNIDWECEVIRDFSNENLGCGKRIFTGLSNAFKKVDRLVIIEDDIVFSDSFLPFCKELLEKFKDDLRIDHICGMNHFGSYHDCNSSYFFTRGGSIWGWATWKRVWDDISWDLHEADDEYVTKTLKLNNYPRKYGEYLSKHSCELRTLIKSGQSPTYWSFHLLYYSYLNSRINIVPTVNLISNIGITIESAHTTSSYKKLTRNDRNFFFQKLNNIQFPLIHPCHVLEDRNYKERQEQLLYPKGWKGFVDAIEHKLRKILFR